MFSTGQTVKMSIKNHILWHESEWFQRRTRGMLFGAEAAGLHRVHPPRLLHTSLFKGLKSNIAPMGVRSVWGPKGSFLALEILIVKHTICSFSALIKDRNIFFMQRKPLCFLVLCLLSRLYWGGGGRIHGFLTLRNHSTPPPSPPP